MQSLRTPRFFGSTPLLGLAALAVLGLAAVLRAAQTQDSIIFGRFAAGGARSSARFLSPASSGSRTSNSVPFWTNAFALGDQFAVENGVPLVTPRSGRHAFAANNTLTTLPPATKTLHGLYLGKIDGPPAAAHVIVNALGPYNPATGTYTVISSTAADALSGTTLSFFNTGAPAVSTKRTGFSGCSLISQSAPAAFGNFDFAGDHSAFSVPAGSSAASAAPEPSALAVWALVGAGLVLRAKKRKAKSVSAQTEGAGETSHPRLSYAFRPCDSGCFFLPWRKAGLGGHPAHSSASIPASRSAGPSIRRELHALRPPSKRGTA